jgi:CubicO group peptidase (beta-lactamase class C family)
VAQAQLSRRGHGVAREERVEPGTLPGEAWRYSVANDVLGRLVEVVSGMPFDHFLQQRIFDPLQMTHTGFFGTLVIL